MIYGNIDYLNLLPVRVFLKRKRGIFYKSGNPKKITNLFLKRRVDFAFISSIKARNCIKIGICAKKEVRSVLIKRGEKLEFDSSSNTSNLLASILGLKGEVIIGDRALKLFFESKNYIDLAKEWYKKYKLPFVFALLCFNKKKAKKIFKGFKKEKIPFYILKKEAKKKGIDIRKALEYLNLIYYNLSWKEELSLKKFFRKRRYENVFMCNI